MALELEDGTGKANATSFVDVDSWKAWAQARSYTVPSDPAIEANALIAVDYIKAREGEYGGDRFSDTQALPFPRVNLEINGVEWTETDPVTPIPQAVIEYQYAIMKALADGIDLFPTTAERAVKRKKTGPLETEWFSADNSPTTPLIDAMLSPLLGGTGAFALTVRRI